MTPAQSPPTDKGGAIYASEFAAPVVERNDPGLGLSHTEAYKTERHTGSVHQNTVMPEELDLQVSLFHTASNGESVTTQKTRPETDSTDVWNNVKLWPFSHVSPDKDAAGNPLPVSQETKSSAETAWNTLWDRLSMSEKMQRRTNLEILLKMRTSPPPGATDQSTWSTR